MTDPDSTVVQTDGPIAAAPEAALPAGGVVLRLDHGTYLVDLANVAEVAPVPEVTRLPGYPQWMCGVANWRGRILAVLDLRPLLGLDRHPQTSASRLVIVSADGVEVAVLVDAVPGVAERTGPARPVPTPAAGLLAAVCEIASGPAAVLDANAVVALRRQFAPTA